MDKRICPTEDITEKRFRDLLLVCRFGSMPLCIKNVSKLRSLYSAIISLCFCLVYVAEWIGVFYSSDLKYVTKILRFAVPNTFVIILDVCFRFRKDEFDNVLKMTEMFIWDDMPERDPKSGKLTMAGWIPRVQKIMKYVLICTMSIHAVQSCFRAIQYRELILASWYPFDTSISPYFEIVYIIQVLSTFLVCSTVYVFPAMFVTSVCIACSQLDKLERNLLRIQQKHHNPEENAYSSCENFAEMQKELNECVRHHQKIIRYLDNLENAMNFPIAGILLTQLITLCTIAFSAIVSWGDIVDMFQSVTLYVLMMLVVFTYCGMGTVITHKYESVREAAWSSDWIGTPVSYQRCILFIIAKSNQEFKLTAGKCVPLSNTTMMNILNESLSFFMFLLTMKDQKKGHDKE